MSAPSRRPPSAAQLRGQVARFNRIAPVPTPVTLRKDNGEIVATQTASEAWILGGHSAVVQLEGISGCWKLDRVSLIDPMKVSREKSASAEAGKSEALASAATAPAHPEGSELSSQPEQPSKGGKS